jgi:hypothetical protein
MMAVELTSRISSIHVVVGATESRGVKNMRKEILEGNQDTEFHRKCAPSTCVVMHDSLNDAGNTSETCQQTATVMCLHQVMEQSRTMIDIGISACRENK